MSRPVVLVHGAWHGAWCWDEVRGRLGSAGIGSTAVELPLSGLADDVAAVTEALDAAGRDAVLVGHSYGGAVITAAGVHPHVGELVYVAAFPLRADESAWTVGSAESGVEDLDYAGRPALAASLTIEDGTAVMSPAGAVTLFYDDCAPDVAARAARRLRPQRLSTLTDLPTAVAWEEKPSTYVVCGADNAVHPGLQRILARRTTAQLELPCGHSPFLSQPAALALALIRIARQPVCA